MGVTARRYGVVEVGGTGAGYGAAGALSAQRRAWLCTEPDDARIMRFLLPPKHSTLPLLLAVHFSLLSNAHSV